MKGRQKSRKMKTIKTSAEQALSFVKSFGLDVEKLVLTSQKEGKVIINLKDCPSISILKMREGILDLSLLLRPCIC